MKKQKHLEIAKFTKPQGLKGHLRAQLYCDSPDVIVEFADALLIGADKKPIDLTLTSVRKGFVVAKIEGVDDIGNAEVFVGESLYINREDYELPENTWFIADLIGLKVIDADNPDIVYGSVAQILQNAPKDVYVLKTSDGKERLFPAIPEVLIDTDLDAGIIKIRPLEGLFDS